MNKLKFMMFLLCLCLWQPRASAAEQEKLLQVLKQELDYNFKELKKQDVSPYYMNFRVMDERNMGVSASFGAIMGVQDQHTRLLIPQIRVGSPELDNFKHNDMGTWKDRNGNYAAAILPLEDEGGEAALRQAVWSEVLKRYYFAVGICDSGLRR